MGQSTIKQLKTRISPVLRQYPIRRVFVFGSYSRGELKKNSDIDFLIEFYRPISLFKMIDLQDRLKGKTHRECDVLTTVPKRLERYILPDLKKVYEKRSVRVS